MPFPQIDSETRAFFESICPSDAQVEVRTMFGNVAGFVNGNMFVGVLGTEVMLRLSGADRAHFVEEGGAMIVGGDTLSFESRPSELEDDYVPLHTYFLAQRGTPILELVYLEELSNDAVYEFAFIGGSLKWRGSDAAPIRPIAIPLR